MRLNTLDIKSNPKYSKETFVIGSTKGSALLISMFIMASVGIISFSVAKIFISEIRSTGSIIGGTAAYYGAEGAMEHLLLQYQIDKRNQFPASSDSVQKTTPMADLTLQMSNPSPLLTTAGRMYYMGDINVLECKVDNPCDLTKDTTREITLPAYGSNPATSIVLNWGWSQLDTGIMRITKTLISPSPQYQHSQGVVSESAASSISETLFADSSSPTLYRFRPLKYDVKYWFSGASPAGTLFDLGKTTIDTKGTYGKSSRQLQAIIDNSTGSLQSVFDYTVLTKDDL